MRLRRRSQKIDVLRQIPLFADLSRRHLDEIAKHADEIDATAGTVLMRQGEIGHELVIIVEGEARVDRDGRELARFGDGSFVGEMALLDGLERSAAVTIT